jgi:hypothetical protein
MAELPKDEPPVSSSFLLCLITWINYEMDLPENANMKPPEGGITPSGGFLFTCMSIES